MTDVTEIDSSLELLPRPAVQQRILIVRGRHVMLDEDLAGLYGVETRRLIEQIKRNMDRFPSDFMFQLTKNEAAGLRSQSATSSTGRGGRRYAPYVFTEQGVAMLSGVLRSKTAIAVNIAIMRAFVDLRRVAASDAAIEKQLEVLERETNTRLGEHDQRLGEIFEALRELISPPLRPKRPVGFRVPDDDKPTSRHLATLISAAHGSWGEEDIADFERALVQAWVTFREPEDSDSKQGIS